MMTADDMRRLRGPYSQEVFGGLIGRTGRRVSQYENGATIELTVEMACAALAAGIYGYSEGKIKKVENSVDADADLA